MRVVVLDDYQQVAASSAPWHELPGAEIVFMERHVDGDELLAALEGAEVIVVIRERTPMSAETLRRLPALRLIVSTGMSNASIDIAAARELGIIVCGTSQLDAAPVELTWALILAVARSVPLESAAMRAGGWQTSVGRALEGATLGIIGLGRLGQRTAKIGAAFGMSVVAWSQNLDPHLAGSLGIEAVTKDDLLHRSDVISLHLRLSDRTRGIIGASELQRMKGSAILINTSRGPIVDEAALIRALNEGWIAGAGLDVYDREPLPVEHPLRRAPRAVLTPHLGYVTFEGFRLNFSEAVENIVAWQAGAPVRRIDGL